MNWKELKQFCNSLPEGELSKNVILWQEDRAITEINAEQLSEDHYIDNEGDMEDCAAKSDVLSMIKESDDYPNGLEDFRKVYDKGTPILWEEI